jgi:hypothetical protein
MPKVLALLLIALLMPSCFLSRRINNEPLQSARLDQLKTGVSTATDVANVLGAPTEVVQLGNRMAWRYDFSNAKVEGFSIIILTFVNEDTRADRAWLFFDTNNVLQYASRTLEADHAEYAMPWMDVHRGHDDSTGAQPVPQTPPK